MAAPKNPGAKAYRSRLVAANRDTPVAKPKPKPRGTAPIPAANRDMSKNLKPVRPKGRGTTVGDALNAVGRFASEVSTNYARGVSQAQKAVGRSPLGKNYSLGNDTPISRALHNEDQTLKNILRGKRGR